MGIELDNKNNLGNADTDKQILFVRVAEKVLLEEQGSNTSKDSIGHSWIVGSSTNGLVGTNTGTFDGSQQVVGGAGRVITYHKVTNINNTFRTRFDTSDFKNSGSTTATWSGNGVVSFTTSQVATSSTCFNCGTVKTATIYVDDPTNLAFEMTANGGTNWESVTHNELHTFTNTGSDLRFRLTASGTASISFLRITYG